MSADFFRIFTGASGFFTLNSGVCVKDIKKRVSVGVGNENRKKNGVLSNGLFVEGEDMEKSSS